jgi:putative membrane protein
VVEPLDLEHDVVSVYRDTMPRVSEADFFTDAAKKRVTEAVADVESHTSAEVVVVVRRSSGNWREADVTVGTLAAFGVLLILLFHPAEIPVDVMPLDVLFAFLAGVVLCSSIPPFKRALLVRKTVSTRVRASACEAFVDQGVSRTRGRSGVLVFVSTFERRVEVVGDIGVDTRLVEAETRALAEAVAGRMDLEAFLVALRRFGPALAGTLPRGDNDVNELPDAPVMA